MGALGVSRSARPAHGQGDAALECGWDRCLSWQPPARAWECQVNSDDVGGDGVAHRCWQYPGWPWHTPLCQVEAGPATATPVDLPREPRALEVFPADSPCLYSRSSPDPAVADSRRPRSAALATARHASRVPSWRTLVCWRRRARRPPVLSAQADHAVNSVEGSDTLPSSGSRLRESRQTAR